MTKQIRVRCAPSNTGPDIHVGNGRSFLFNWLYARQNNGVFVLRFEDSDQARSKDEYANNILETMHWLGLSPDEGYGCSSQPYPPYKQSEKFGHYMKVANQLIEKGFAYRCYCTQEELNNLRNQLPEKDRFKFRYPGICRNRKDNPDKDYVVRLVSPTAGSVEINDMVFGKTVFPNVENYDYVLVRSNGCNLYNFGCVVDDIDMDITTVIRGVDHLQNSHIQKLIYTALGKEMPQTAHLSMLMGQDNSKLSKRHGSVNIAEFRKNGYSPDALISYICKFGWGHKDKEFFTRQELIDCFDITKCVKSNGKFDFKKLSSIQFDYLKNDLYTSSEGYAKHLFPFLSEQLPGLTLSGLLPLIPLVRSRSKTFVEAASELLPILQKDIPIDPEAAKKLLTEETKPRLEQYGEFLKSFQSWDETTLRSKTQEWLIQNNFVLKDIGQPLRVSLVGKTNSPELFQVMAALGKDTTIARINNQV